MRDKYMARKPRVFDSCMGVEAGDGSEDKELEVCLEASWITGLRWFY